MVSVATALGGVRSRAGHQTASIELRFSTTFRAKENDGIKEINETIGDRISKGNNEEEREPFTVRGTFWNRLTWKGSRVDSARSRVVVKRMDCSRAWGKGPGGVSGGVAERRVPDLPALPVAMMVVVGGGVGGGGCLAASRCKGNESKSSASDRLFCFCSILLNGLILFVFPSLFLSGTALSLPLEKSAKKRSLRCGFVFGQGKKGLESKGEPQNTRVQQTQERFTVPRGKIRRARLLLLIFLINFYAGPLILRISGISRL
ncbi:hypothetical protein V1477_007744 [Vespula maculifrons]|uniref:Uncharacterized protein n=1 Tax=Vespula maculifrons TaxID=7453 RepID=A0ABD2CI10_VESMC